MSAPHTSPPQRWLVTGGCGFIGRSVIADLLPKGGHAVRVLDNHAVGTRDDLATVCEFRELTAAELMDAPRPPLPGVELVAGDILDASLVRAAAEGVDAIVHLAANTGVAPSVEDPRADCVTNVIGTLNVLEAARAARVPRVVFASSGAPMGEAEPPLHEELPAKPLSPYGASKLAGEGYCSAYFHTFGVETVALRFGNVYGPNSGHKSSVVARFIRRAMAGEPLEVYGDGHQTRDFIYIDDLVRAIQVAATVPGIGGEIFQIATSAETSVQELLGMLLPALADAGIPPVAVETGPRRTGDMNRNYSDTRKAAARLGWQAEVGLPEGLRRTVQWFADRVPAAARAAPPYA